MKPITRDLAKQLYPVFSDGTEDIQNDIQEKFIDAIYDSLDELKCENCATYYDGQCSLIIVYGLTYCSMFKHK